MTARMRQFERVVSIELPALFDDFDLDADARSTLTGYAEELKDWLAGILTWHQGCHRYEESELRYHPPAGTQPFGGPTGLGTSTAHLEPFFATGAPLVAPLGELTCGALGRGAPRVW